MKKQVKYLGQRSFSSKLLSAYTYKHTSDRLLYWITKMVDETLLQTNSLQQ